MCGSLEFLLRTKSWYEDLYLRKQAYGESEVWSFVNAIDGLWWLRVRDLDLEGFLGRHIPSRDF